jgi:hypothetical protein
MADLGARSGWRQRRGVSSADLSDRRQEPGNSGLRLGPQKGQFEPAKQGKDFVRGQLDVVCRLHQIGGAKFAAVDSQQGCRNILRRFDAMPPTEGGQTKGELHGRSDDQRQFAFVDPQLDFEAGLVSPKVMRENLPFRRHRSCYLRKPLTWIPRPLELYPKLAGHVALL